MLVREVKLRSGPAGLPTSATADLPSEPGAPAGQRAMEAGTSAARADEDMMRRRGRKRLSMGGLRRLRECTAMKTFRGAEPTKLHVAGVSFIRPNPEFGKGCDI